jgi:DNA-binding MarR family transcriptional regulator
MLELLRDELLSINGLRWVLCGALGIVFGVVSSPRLEGYLHKPIEVLGIDDKHAPLIVESRVSVFGQLGAIPYLPLTSGNFVDIYQILHGNIRSVLSQADDYCQWVADRMPPVDDTSKIETFWKWLLEQSEMAYNAVKQELRPKAIEVFKTCIEFGGIFSPSDFEEFGFNSIPAFRPHIRDLEAVGVLVSTQDDGDKRRKTIQVTPKGWLVDFYISQLEKSTKANDSN